MLLSPFYRLLLKLEIFLTWIILQHLWTPQSTVMECRKGPWMMEVSCLWLVSLVDAAPEIHLWRQLCFEDGKCSFLCVEILNKLPCAVYSYLDCTVFLGSGVNVKQFFGSSWPLGISKQTVSFKSWSVVVEGGRRICLLGLFWSPHTEQQVCTVHVLPWWPFFSEHRKCVGTALHVFLPPVTMITPRSWVAVEFWLLCTWLLRRRSIYIRWCKLGGNFQCLALLSPLLFENSEISEEFKIGHSQRIVYCMDQNW